MKTQQHAPLPASASDSAPASPLGKLGARAFLERHWQKRPLLVRQAIPGFAGVAGRDELFRLAADASVESRLVQRRSGRWSLAHGPLSATKLRCLPARDWTLLVQGVNLHLPAADRLLRRFDFIPHARLDDLMVSYAAPGGGVGPHLDSYDVFLLQAGGSRVWRIGRPRSEAARALVAGAPLKLLRRFEPEQEFLLEPGDMLYLPPGWAHDGVALDASMTCSVGFRAPSRQELVAEFLQRHAERIDLPGLYADPGLRPQRHAAQIPAALIAATQALLSQLRFSRADVSGFLGEYLSEPKARVVFDRPARAMSRQRFAQATARAGLRLDARSLMLLDARNVFINGERVTPPRAALQSLRLLADARTLAPGATGAAVLDLLYPWYLSGWLHAGRDWK